MDTFSDIMLTKVLAGIFGGKTCSFLMQKLSWSYDKKVGVGWQLITIWKLFHSPLKIIKTFPGHGEKLSISITFQDFPIERWVIFAGVLNYNNAQKSNGFIIFFFKYTYMN